MNKASLSLTSYLESIECKLRNDLPKFLLLGVGPFAKKHYFNVFSKYNIYPELVVDLTSKKDEITEFLESRNLSIDTLFIPSVLKDEEKLPNEIKKRLFELIEKHKITHAILATEPKAHFAYLDFFIEHGIHTLVEKPIIATPFSSFSYEAAEKISTQYFYLLEKLKNSKTNPRVEVQCQRRYHPIYQFVMKQIEQFVTEYNIPMTYCDLYHCDGMWNMPNEFISRENHPYKYGYGKLLHSGYHFIDLLACLLKTTFGSCTKAPDNAELYAQPFTTSDFLHAIGQEDYFNLFKTREHTEIFEENGKGQFQNYGELDFFSILQLFRKGQRITTCNMNFMQTGFSRRAWTELPEDTYKGNGRIRHERINLQFGHLFNIQVHSYLSQESREEPVYDVFKAGGSRHFDIMLFRNSSLIGGEAYQHFPANSFTTNESESFNQSSRRECLFNFLLNRASLSSLKDHELGIKLLCQSLKALSRSHMIQKFSILESDFFGI